jgi:hypothetical protein
MTVVERLAAGRRGVARTSLGKHRWLRQIKRAMRGFLHVARPAA